VILKRGENIKYLAHLFTSEQIIVGYARKTIRITVTPAPRSCEVALVLTF